MPFYTYRCDVCDVSVAKFRKYGDQDSPSPCDICRLPMSRAGVELFAVGGHSQPPSGTQRPAHNASPAGKFVVEDCHFENIAGRMINIENTSADISNTSFKNVGQSIRARNSKVRMRNVKSD